MSYQVLVIDDSKLARMAVAKLLSALHPDWNRIEAGNADEALDLLERHRPDFILLDFNMPGRNGLELATDLRRMRPTTPLAMISANHQNEIVERAHSIGAEFLAKPLTEEDLGKFFTQALQTFKAIDA